MLYTKQGTRKREAGRLLLNELSSRFSFSSFFSFPSLITFFSKLNDYFIYVQKNARGKNTKCE